VLWAIFGAFWGSNAILLVALFKDGDFPTNHWVGAIIATVGASQSFVWQHIQARALGGIERHEATMHAIEEHLNIPETLCIMAPAAPGVRARGLMRACSIVGFIIWLLATLVLVPLAVLPGR
jgi:hypothetical protein